jgi:hypothetical protein
MVENLAAKPGGKTWRFMAEGLVVKPGGKTWR